MADGELTMFGKAYDTVGSTNKNLVLLTRGDLKVRWGNKFIDLIKNGKINADVEVLQKVGDVNEIVKDGIYLIEKEEGNEIWLSIGGTTINIFGEVSDNYVAFVKEQDIDAENKFKALSNIGFYYESMEKAKEKQIKKGLVFLLDQNKLYYVNEGEFQEYIPTLNLEIPSPLKLKNITIDGEAETISGTDGLYFNISNELYFLLLSDIITFDKQLITKNTISSDDFQSGLAGYAIYNDNKDYIGEFDVIKVRKSIIYDEILNVTYTKLRSLMEGHQLYPGKQYRITDFFNEWDYYQYDLTSEQGATLSKVYEDPSNILFYFPIVVTATSNNTLAKQAYFCENKQWIIEYDPTFNYLICEADVEGKDGVTRVPIYARGRITKLTDEYGNVGNYDFKHRLFKATLSSDDRKTWIYTYNKTRSTNTSDPLTALSWEYIHSNWDASADGDIVNNIVYMAEPELETYNLNGETVKKIKESDDYFIFDCTNNIPHDNAIKYSKGKFNVTGPFYNNKFSLLISAESMTFSLDFHDNIFLGVQDCVLNAPMQYNTFDRNLVNVAFRCDNMKENHITGIIYTNTSRSTYPIEATNFNNNTINNINMSSITCYGCDIVNVTAHNINGCTIENSNLTDITMKDITGEGSYSNNPTDTIEGGTNGNNSGNNSGNNPGGGPVNPGGNDEPVNPGGDLPTLDGTLDSFISKLTGGHADSEMSTVLTSKISSTDTPNTYAYLQSGFNYVSGKSDALKSWMLANMLAELTPVVKDSSGTCYVTTPSSGDTATNYFVNAAKCFGGLKIDYLANEQVYMDRINGAVEYAKFKHSNYAASNTAAEAARTELRSAGVSQAAMRSNSTLIFARDEAPHAFPITPDGMPSNSSSSGDWTFTQSMITQYPTPASMSSLNYQPLLDKEGDTGYICKILGLDPNIYADYAYKCSDIGDAGGNPYKATYKRPRPGTQNNINTAEGNTTFTVPSGGSVYLCDCAIEFSDLSNEDSEWNYDCSTTNNGKTYCEDDVDKFTNPAKTGQNPYMSYQSGHSSAAFIKLLVLLEAAGDSMNKDGYTSRTQRIHDYCLNRVRVRAHWKTDTIVGRLASSMQIGFLNGFNEFHTEIAKL